MKEISFNKNSKISLITKNKKFSLEELKENGYIKFENSAKDHFGTVTENYIISSECPQGVFEEITDDGIVIEYNHIKQGSCMKIKKVLKFLSKLLDAFIEGGAATCEQRENSF